MAENRRMFGRLMADDDLGAFFIADIASDLEQLEGLYQDISYRNTRQERQDETMEMSEHVFEIEEAFREYREGMEEAATDFVDAYWEYAFRADRNQSGLTRRLAFSLVAFETMITMRDELENYVKAYLQEVMDDLAADPIV